MSHINTYSLSRVCLAFVWLYHGLIPKLIFQHVTELKLISLGPILYSPKTTLMIAGVLEVLMGLALLVFWNRAWPATLSFISFSVLMIGAIIISPAHATHAFNPVTLSTSGIVLAWINAIEHRERYPASSSVE